MWVKFVNQLGISLILPLPLSLSLSRSSYHFSLFLQFYCLLPFLSSRLRLKQTTLSLTFRQPLAMEELQTYRRCIGQQLEELELLSSIYCAPGELHLLDAGVVADFNEFLGESESEVPSPVDVAATLRSNLEYIIKLTMPAKRTVDVRIELPHLYPQLELARISVNTTLLGKVKEEHLKVQIKNYLLEQCTGSEEPYVYQVLSWLQEQIEKLLLRPASEFENPTVVGVEEQQQQQQQPSSRGTTQELERIWIYSHHIKSSAKRQELVRQARQMQLTGFSRPGKPGIICVEGRPEQVQEYWRSIKALRWQKITLVRTEQRQRKRYFENFSEQLFNASNDADDEGVMNMGQFIKFLETHGAGYMKSELFGLD